MILTANHDTVTPLDENAEEIEETIVVDTSKVAEKGRSLNTELAFGMETDKSRVHSL
jgi:hypothetical protein